MKNPAQFLDNPVSIKRNMMSQWETSPNKKKKSDVSEEEEETEKKHNSSVFLIDTRFCQDSELDSTVDSTDDEINEEIKEELEEESESDEDQDQIKEEEIETHLKDSNKNFEIFLYELKQSVEASEESVDGFPPTLSSSKYPIKNCRVMCRKLDPAVKGEEKINLLGEDKEGDDDDDDEIEVLDDPACSQCGLSLQSVSTFSPGVGCSEAEVVANMEINLISLETARKEGWQFCLQATNVTVYDDQDHILSFEKV